MNYRAPRPCTYALRNSRGSAGTTQVPGFVVGGWLGIMGWTLSWPRQVPSGVFTFPGRCLFMLSTVARTVEGFAQASVV